MRDPEYDRFGPWILEITEEDPLPPLFVSYMTRKEEPFFNIKIPRPIDRRDLSPGENMYDYVVSIYEKDLYILERVGDEVREQSIPYESIIALRHSEDLLDGNLFIYINNRCYKLPYSTVSSEIISRLIEILRQRYISTSSSRSDIISNRKPEPVSGELSFLFSGLLASAGKNHSDMKLLAFQSEIPVNSIEGKPWKRLFLGAIDKRLLESLHMCNGIELEIINRGRTWGYRWQAIYGKETLFLPLENIMDMNREYEKSSRGIENLIFQTAGSRHSFSFTRENPALPGYFKIIEDAAI